MGITSDRETPAQIVHLINTHHRSPSWRLAVALILVRDLERDAKALGYPVTTAILGLAHLALADASTTATHMEADYFRRLAVVSEAIRRGEIGPDEAPAEVIEAAMQSPAAEPSPHDLPAEVIDKNQRAVERLSELAPDLDTEGGAA